MAEFVEKSEVRPWALLGRLVDVRALSPDARLGLQDRLRDVLLDAGGSIEWVASPAITGGDAFLGLVRRPAPALAAVRAIADALRGHAVVRFGLGHGRLVVGPDAQGLRPVGEFDGPCIHAAHRAADRAAEHDLWVALEGEDGPLDPALESLLEWVGIERRAWTEKQAQTVELARTRLQQDVAAMLDVAPSVVSERLRAAHFDPLLRAEAALAAALERLADEVAP